MSDIDLQARTEELNRRLMTYPWLDFEVWVFDARKLTICGSISTSRPGDIFIDFHDVFMLSAPFQWRTDTSKEVLRLLDDSDPSNLTFKIEYGYHVFRFQPEYFPPEFGCYVAAQNLTWREKIRSAGQKS